MRFWSSTIYIGQSARNRARAEANPGPQASYINPPGLLLNLSLMIVRTGLSHEWKQSSRRLHRNTRNYICRTASRQRERRPFKSNASPALPRPASPREPGQWKSRARAASSNLRPDFRIGEKTERKKGNEKERSAVGWHSDSVVEVNHRRRVWHVPLVV